MRNHDLTLMMLIFLSRQIIDYVRRQRAQPGYNPDTSHAICGQDADLIMLALALHEPRAVVLREQVWLGKKRGDKYKRFERARFKPLQVRAARCLQSVLARARAFASGC